MNLLYTTPSLTHLMGRNQQKYMTSLILKMKSIKVKSEILDNATLLLEAYEVERISISVSFVHHDQEKNLGALAGQIRSIEKVGY